MRSFAILSAAGLAAAQFTSIVITDGITATLTLPVFPEPTPTTTVVVTVPETTVTVTPEPETSTTVSGGFTTTTLVVVSDPPVTITTPIVIPTVSVSDPAVTLPTITESTFNPATTITAVFPPSNTTLATHTHSYFTSSPNATTTGPVVVPTAAAEKLQGSAVGLVAFGIASLFLL
ncbi:hypothetical protein EsH8_II_000397 [Colletotrichum jinshuiense]